MPSVLNLTIVNDTYSLPLSEGNKSKLRETKRECKFV